MKKKVLLIALAALLVVGAGTGVWYFKFRDGGKTAASENAVFVDSVASITGLDAGTGTQSRFAGVVEPQKTVNVEVASGMKVKETYVSVGQQVSVGTKLFSYDTEEAQDNITQLEIDIENYDITIESTNSQIQQLKKERDKVSGDEKLAYTTQIMTAENSVKRSEYEKKSKQAEMEKLKKQIANAYETSEIEGVVKSINRNNSGNEDSLDMGSMSSEENSNAYITIMATGDYRVKGMVNEQNIQQIMEGTDVLIHSRVDESVWHGTISNIDREGATQNQNNSAYMMMGSGESMTTSNSYPFYVELEDSVGLMLGQHVYVEPDNGQEEMKDGIWLPDYYLIVEESGEYSSKVWAASSDDKLEIRELTLGEYDEDLMEYEILEGLTADDYIAFPMEEYQEGMAVTRNTDQMGGSADNLDDLMEMGYEDDAGLEEYGGEEFLDDGMMMDGGEEFLDDGMMMDGGEEFLDDGMMMDDGEFLDEEMMMDDGEFLDEGLVVDEGFVDEG